MGTCLGAQLIAKACGAAVSPAPLAEIGLAPSHLTEQGKQSPLACFAEQPLAMHCGQNFTLPEQAECLAYTEHYPNQAFRIGDKVIGFQFHPGRYARTAASSPASTVRINCLPNSLALIRLLITDPANSFIELVWYHHQPE